MEILQYVTPIMLVVIFCFWIKCLFSDGFRNFFSILWNSKTEGLKFFSPIHNAKLIYQNYKSLLIDLSQFWKTFVMNILIAFLLSIICSLGSGYKGFLFLIEDSFAIMIITLILAFIFFLLKKLWVFKIISSIFLGILKLIFRRETWEVAKSGYKRGRNYSKGNNQSFFKSYKTSETKVPAKSFFNKEKTNKVSEPIYQTGNNSNFSNENTSSKKETNNMKTDSTQRKYCYNCAFWTGQRSFKDVTGNLIEYNDTPAKCAPNGGMPNANMSPRATCAKFSKLGG